MEKYILSEIIKPFDIIFTYKKASLLSKVIWFFSTFSIKKAELKYSRRTSHCLLNFIDGMIVEIDERGIRLLPFKNFDPEKYIISVGRVKKPINEQLLTTTIMQSLDNSKYDFLRLGVIAIQRILGIGTINDYSRRAVICSEAIIDFFRKIEIDLVPGKESSSSTPLDISQSTELNIFLPKVQGDIQ